tara:strand:- start:7738 stop:7962 length:225 start_codon:yes stop_codon:yes gene_type:complete
MCDFVEKKVSIDPNDNIIFIPTKEELSDNFNVLWYDDDQLEKIKNEAISEIKVYSVLKNISFKEARKDIYIKKN